MTEINSTTQPEEGKSTKKNKEAPQYLPFAFVQIKQVNHHVSSIEEAQSDFVARAGIPAALPDKNKTENTKA